MNYNSFLYYDFETCSKSASTTQPLQLSAVAIDGRKLEIMESDMFNSYIKPIFDPEECLFYNLDTVQDEALAVNKIQRETLENAPPLKTVWDQFCNYVNQYNYKKTKFTSPIKAGYNNTNFDDIIIDRIAGGNNRHLKLISGDLSSNIKNTICAIKDSGINDNYVDQLCKLSKKLLTDNEPYNFGYWDGKCTLFNLRDSIDLMHIIWWWTENLQEVRSISMDSVRDWLGISKEGAHDAKIDVLQGAQILVRFLKFTRRCSSNAKFKGSFK